MFTRNFDMYVKDSQVHSLVQVQSRYTVELWTHLTLSLWIKFTVYD